MSSSLLYHWKKQYSKGKFNNEPTEEGALRNRTQKLERLVVRLILENESSFKLELPPIGAAGGNQMWWLELLARTSFIYETNAKSVAVVLSARLH
jgi:hypothetical protein